MNDMQMRGFEIEDGVLVKYRGSAAAGGFSQFRLGFVVLSCRDSGDATCWNASRRLIRQSWARVDKAVR
ncbi:MAG: hypothetical protein LBE74_00920 [Treponema sp.]|nr:hypothetical protein [Treponema sp.]